MYNHSSNRNTNKEQGSFALNIFELMCQKRCTKMAIALHLPNKFLPCKSALHKIAMAQTLSIHIPGNALAEADSQMCFLQ